MEVITIQPGEPLPPGDKLLDTVLVFEEGMVAMIWSQRHETTEEARPVMQASAEAMRTATTAACTLDTCDAQIGTHFERVPEGSLELLCIGVICARATTCPLQLRSEL